MLDNVDSINIDYLEQRRFDNFEEFILSAPPLQYIQLSRHNCYDNHITSLSITSGVDIKFSANDTLIKNFYSQVKECDANNLSNDDLVKFVKNACNTYNETKSTNNKSMQYLHALKILMNFDFTAIDQRHSNFKDKLKSIYESQEVKLEIYHLQLVYVIMTNILQKHMLLLLQIKFGKITIRLTKNQLKCL